MIAQMVVAIVAFSAAVLSASEPASEREIAPSSLVGVWEVVACANICPQPASAPKSVSNLKYCFGPDEAYPGLSPDSPGDSADGGGSYYLVGGDILVIKTGAVGGILAYEITSVTKDRLVWLEGTRQFTLRRIAKEWRVSHVPKVRPRKIPVTE